MSISLRLEGDLCAFYYQGAPLRLAGYRRLGGEAAAVAPGTCSPGQIATLALSHWDSSSVDEIVLFGISASNRSGAGTDRKQLTTVFARQGLFLFASRFREVDRAPQPPRPIPTRELMTLPETFAGWIAGFGAKTRRNLRHALRQARREGLECRLELGRIDLSSEHLAVASDGHPHPTPSARMESIVQGINAHGFPFVSSLVHPLHGPISHCYGYVDGCLAFLIHQTNSARHLILSPSLTHRALLAEQLIDDSMTGLVMTNGGALPFSRYLEPLRVGFVLTSITPADIPRLARSRLSFTLRSVMSRLSGQRRRG